MRYKHIIKIILMYYKKINKLGTKFCDNDNDKDCILTLAMLINETERGYGKLYGDYTTQYVDFAGKIICDFTKHNINDKK